MCDNAADIWSGAKIPILHFWRVHIPILRVRAPAIMEQRERERERCLSLIRSLLLKLLTPRPTTIAAIDTLCSLSCAGEKALSAIVFPENSPSCGIYATCAARPPARLHTAAFSGCIKLNCVLMTLLSP